MKAALAIRPKWRRASALACLALSCLVLACLTLACLTFACLSLAGPVAVSPALADNWTVTGDLAGKGGASKDMSGIACATASGFPRTCLVIDDELQAAQVVTLTDGKIIPGELIPLISDSFKGKPVELDGEGVAFADNYFYVIGSHGRPRRSKDVTDPADEAARIAAGLAASSKLVRLTYDAATGKIATDPAVPPSTALARLIAAEPLFAPFTDRPLEEGGITIEGVAVLGERIFAGFRGPVVKDDSGKDRAVILSAALGHFFDGKPADAKVHRLKLGPGRGVRDLAAFDGGVLVLAGPVQSVNGTYSVYWWNGVTDRAKRLADLPDFFDTKQASKKDGAQWKPEALLPLGRNANGVRVLLLLDSAKNGMPRSLRIAYP